MMKKTWKKALAGICAAAMVMTGISWPAMTVDAEEYAAITIDKDAVVADSYEATGEGRDNGRIEDAFDGNTSTFWHTNYNDSSAAKVVSSDSDSDGINEHTANNTVTIPLSGKYIVSGISIMPRQYSTPTNGLIVEFKVAFYNGNALVDETSLYEIENHKLAITEGAALDLSAKEFTFDTPVKEVTKVVLTVTKAKGAHITAAEIGLKGAAQSATTIEENSITYTNPKNGSYTMSDAEKEFYNGMTSAVIEIVYKYNSDGLDDGVQSLFTIHNDAETVGYYTVCQNPTNGLVSTPTTSISDGWKFSKNETKVSDSQYHKLTVGFSEDFGSYISYYDGANITNFGSMTNWKSYFSSFFALTNLTNVVIGGSAEGATYSIGQNAFNGSIKYVKVTNTSSTLADMGTSHNAVPEELTNEFSALYEECTTLSQKSNYTKETLNVLKEALTTYASPVGEWGYYNAIDALTAAKDGLELVAAEFTNGTASLKGKIDVNFYVKVNDTTALNNLSVKLTRTKADEEKTVETVTEGFSATNLTEDGLYKFTFDVAAKEMTDVITAELLNGTESIATTSLSVKEYADAAKAYYPGNTKLEDLLNAMLNYGAAAQTHFRYNTSDLANAGVVKDFSNITSIDVADATITKGIEGLDVNVSLLLKSDTVLRFYLTAGEGVDLSKYTVTPALETGKTYAEFTDIAAKDLDEVNTFTVTDGTNTTTVSYSPLHYAKAVVGNESAAETLKTVAKALYEYNACANTYFGE